MTVTYRDATVKDAETIDRLFDRSFCDTFAHLYRPEDLKVFLSRFTIADWEAEIADPRFAFRIAECDGEPLGYVKVGPMDLPIEPERLEAAREIYQFYLLDSAKGTGVADELMRWAIDQARELGGTELFLSVFIDNHRARRFYARYGFTIVGPYKFMVGEQADEDVIMSLAL